MAVRMLAGPFQIRTREGKLPTSAVGICGYYPQVGLIGQFNYSGGNAPAGVITLDGIHESVHQFAHPQISWWPERGRMVRPIFMEEFELDPRTLAYRLIGKYEFFLPGPPYVYIKQRTRWLYVFPGTIAGTMWARDEVTGADSVYCQLPYAYVTSMSPGRGVGEVFLGTQIGEHAAGYFFNYEGQRQASELFYYGGTAPPWYSPEHQVMITVENPDGKWGQLKVWSQEVEPSIVTDAVVVRSEARAGCVPTYQVRVTGAQGEPCPKEFVDWTIQGAGRLEHLQSITDDEGYAEVKVIYGLHEEGDSTIRASVRC